MKVIQTLNQKISPKSDLKSIHVLIWDVDGTLYRNNVVAEQIYKSLVKQVANNKNISYESASELVDLEGKKGYSWGKSAENTTGIEESKLLKIMEKEVDKAQYIKEDKRLLKAFTKLSEKNYKHYVLTNSTLAQTKNVLDALGLNPNTFRFETIFSLESIPKLKPHRSGFLEVMKHSGLNPNNHLMIGDRNEIDIIPAKSLGMFACFVGQSNNKFSDFSVSHPADILQFLPN